MRKTGFDRVDKDDIRYIQPSKRIIFDDVWLQPSIAGLWFLDWLAPALAIVVIASSHWYHRGFGRETDKSQTENVKPVMD